MLAHARDRNDPRLPAARVAGYVCADLLEALDILELRCQIRNKMPVLLSLHERTQGWIQAVMVHHAEAARVQLVLQIFIALDGLLLIREIHENQDQRGGDAHKRFFCLTGGRKRGVRARRNTRFLQDFHHHIRRDVRREVADVVHDRANDHIGVSRRIRRHLKRHQICALDDVGARLCVEALKAQILADFFLEQAAVEDVGEAGGH